MENFIKSGLWIWAAFVVVGAVVNFGGFCDLVASVFQMCFWPGLIAVGIVAAVVAIARR
jgi:hypothetical protein